MLRIVDRIFGVLLALAAAGHTVGTILWTQRKSGIFIWSLGSSLAAFLLAALNIVRAGRPDDKTLAVIATLGTACWALVAFAFGLSIHNVLDPRPLGHVIISIVLLVFSIATLLQKSVRETSRVEDSAIEAAGSPRRV